MKLSPIGTVGLLASCLLAGALTSPARATLLAQDNFTYADGILAGNNGGIGWGGAWGNAGGNVATTGTAAVSVVGNQAVWGTSGNDFVYRSLGPDVTGILSSGTGTLWMSFDALVNNGVVFAGISLMTGTAETAYLGKNGLTSTVWSIVGYNNPAKLAVASTTSIQDLLRKGVVRITLNGTSATYDVWIGNDATGIVDASGTPFATTTSGDPKSIATLRLAGSGTFAMDNLAIGTTAGDVGATITPIPEPSVVLLEGLALGFLLLGRRPRSMRGC
jgi:hypothetical protein